MEWFASNWPVLLIILAVAFLATAIVRKLVKLALFALLLGVIGFVIWPLVTGNGT